MNWTWMENAEWVTDGSRWILGEDERGDILAPDWRRPGVWRRGFTPSNPLHWAYYLRSRTTNRIAFLKSRTPVRRSDAA